MLYPLSGATRMLSGNCNTGSTNFAYQRIVGFELAGVESVRLNVQIRLFYCNIQKEQNVLKSNSYKLIGYQCNIDIRPFMLITFGIRAE